MNLIEICRNVRDAVGDDDTLFGIDGELIPSLDLVLEPNWETSITSFGGTGSDAELIPVIRGGSISEIKVNNGGTGYGATDFVTFTFGSTTLSWLVHSVDDTGAILRVEPDGVDDTSRMANRGTGLTNYTVTSANGYMVFRRINVDDTGAIYIGDNFTESFVSTRESAQPSTHSDSNVARRGNAGFIYSVDDADRKYKLAVEFEPPHNIAVFAAGPELENDYAEIEIAHNMVYTNNEVFALFGTAVNNVVTNGAIDPSVTYSAPLTMHVYPSNQPEAPGHHGFVLPLSSDELLVRRYGLDRGTVAIAITIRVQMTVIEDRAEDLLNFIDNLDPRSIQQRLKRNLNQPGGPYIDYHVARTQNGLDAFDDNYLAGTVVLTVQRGVDEVPANLAY